MAEKLTSMRCVFCGRRESRVQDPVCCVENARAWARPWEQLAEQWADEKRAAIAKAEGRS